MSDTVRSVGKGAAVLAGGVFFGQAITAAVSPILTRLYTPEEFGIFGVYVSALYFCLSIASARYDVPLVLEDDKSRQGHLFWLSLLPIPVVAIFSGLIGVFASLGQNSASRAIFGLGLPLGVVFGGAYNVLTAMALSEKRHLRISSTRAIQSTASACFQVFLFPFSGGALSLVGGQIVGMTFGIRRLWPSSSTLPQFNLKKTIALARKFSLYPLYDAPNGMCQTANTHVPAMLIAMQSSLSLAGVYALVQRVVATPMAVVANAISSSLISHKEMTGPRRSAERVAFAQAHAAMSVAIGPSITFGAVVLHYIFGAIFGPLWSQYSDLAAWLILFIGHKFLFDSATQLVSAAQLQRHGLALQAGILVARIGALASSLFILDSVSAALIVFSIVSAYAYAIGGAIQQSLLGYKDRLAQTLLGVDIALSSGVIYLIDQGHWYVKVNCALVYLAWTLWRIRKYAYPWFLRRKNEN